MIIGYIVYTGKEGYLVNIGSESAYFREVWCESCLKRCDTGTIDKEDAIALHRVNIGVYSQLCHSCGKVLVDGMRKRNGSFLELFAQERV